MKTKLLRRLIDLFIAAYVLVFQMGPAGYCQDHQDVSQPKPNIEDVSEYVRNHYERQEAAFRALFSLKQDELPEGFQWRIEDQVLEVEGRYRPDLISLDKGLTEIFTHFRNDQAGPGSIKAALLASGFPLDEMDLLAETAATLRLSEYQQSARQLLVQKHEKVMDCFQDPSDEEISRYATEALREDRVARINWSVAVLTPFSPFAVQVLLQLIKNRNATKSDFGRVQPLKGFFISEIKEKRRIKRNRLIWKGTPVSATVAPPFLFAQPKSKSPFWLRWDTVTSNDTQQLVVNETGMGEGVQMQAAEKKMTRLFQRQTEHQRNHKDVDPLCARDVCSAALSFETLYKQSPGIFLAQVINATPGFLFERPASLLTLKVDQWLRKPTAGAHDRYYLAFPKTSFTISGVQLCATNDDYPDALKGKRVLIFAVRQPYDDDGQVLFVPASAIFAEDQWGQVQGHALEGEDPVSFDLFVKTVIDTSASLLFDPLIEGFE